MKYMKDGSNAEPTKSHGCLVKTCSMSNLSYCYLWMSFVGWTLTCSSSRETVGRCLEVGLDEGILVCLNDRCRY